MSKRGIWLNLEGGDAVGKSTQIPKVVHELRKRGIKNVRGVDEFSNSPVGVTINKIIEKQRFFALNKDKTSPLADTSLLLADLVYCYETIIAPTLEAGGIVVTDRGPLSIIGYQAVRIAERSVFSMEESIDWAQALISHYALIPDLTVLLNISTEELKKRVVGRGESPLLDDEVHFLEQVDKVMLETIDNLSDQSVIMSGSLPVEEITQQISDLAISCLKSH